MGEREITVELTRICSSCGAVVVDTARTKVEKEALYKEVARPTKCAKCLADYYIFVDC